MVTREEIVWAYRAILGREPESESDFVWHGQHEDFDALRKNVIQSDEGSALLRKQLGPIVGDQHFTSIIDHPSGGRITERITQISGFVQSSEPIPPIKIIFDSKTQDWVRLWSTQDPKAPWVRRYTAHWSCYAETITHRQRSMLVEVFVGSRLVGRHTLKPKLSLAPRVKKPEPLVYFMHIEKTAGTSLRAMVRQENRKYLEIYNDINFVPHEICRTFSRSAFNELDFVYGHFPFGLHECFDRACTYMSMARHPVEIVKSYYLYVKYLSPSTKFDKCRSIYDAVDLVSDRVFDNILVRYFSGNDGERSATESDLSAAIDNIEANFSLVGLSEDFEQSCRCICQRLGVPYSETIENQTPPTEEGRSIDSASLRTHLGKSIDLDLCLYDFLAERWYKMRRDCAQV